MMNFIAIAITGYLVGPYGPLTASDQLPASPRITESAELPQFWGSTRLTAGIFIAFGAAFVIWLILWHTRLGYRIRAVGLNASAAEYAGINISYHLTISMAISGALGGLAGAVQVLGIHHRFFEAFSPGFGFDAIAIALVGQLHPLGVTAAALFFGFLRAGAILMQQTAQVPRDIIFIISSVINIALEGKMLMGAFVAVVTSYFTGSPWLGVLSAIFIGGLVGFLHAFLTIDLRANHVVSATAINITAVGLTNVLIIAVWKQPGASPLVDRILPTRVPLLSSVPVVGELFASQNLLTYVALALIPISYHLLFRTPWGLRVRGGW